MLRERSGRHSARLPEDGRRSRQDRRVNFSDNNPEPASPRTFRTICKKISTKFRIPEPRAQMPIYKCIIRKEEPCGALFFGYFGTPFSPIGIFSVWISGFFVLSCNCNHPLGTKKIDTYFLKLPRNPLFPSRKNRTKSSITCLQAFGPNGRNHL